MGVAAGPTATGRTVFMHSFGCFASRRAFDQAFMSAAYAKLPVHVIGSDPGVCAAYNGGTHMPFEDCALYICPYRKQLLSTRLTSLRSTA